MTRSRVVCEESVDGKANRGHQYADVAAHPGADLAWRVGIVPGTAARALAAELDREDAAGLLAAEALRIAAMHPAAQIGEAGGWAVELIPLEFYLAR